MSDSFAVGPLSNRPPAYQNQHNEAGGYLRPAAVGRGILAVLPEILAEIFVHCLPEWPRPDPQDAPQLLCRICRRFREVALSTPRLWSSLWVDPEKHNDFCRTWLSRAQSIPLSLKLSDDGYLPTDPEHPLLSTIIGCSRQCRTLEISDGLFWETLLSGGSRSLNGKVPLLEELKIWDPDVVVLHDAPELRILSISAHNPELHLPWHQLTKLHLSFTHIPDSIQVLRDSINLVQAAFEFDYESSTRPVSNFRHPRLRCLALGPCNDDEDEDERATPLAFLDCAEIPSLTELIVVLPWQNLPYHPMVNTLSPLLSFLSHPSLRLHTLALSFPYSPLTETMENMMECLKLAPSLAHFKFRAPSLTDIAILFARLTGHADFLPRLEYLQLTFSDAVYPDPPALMSLVIKMLCRWAAIPPAALPKSDVVYRDRPNLVSLVIGMLCWRWAAVGFTQLKSFRLTYISPLAPYLDFLKSESEFRRLEEEGMLLYVGETQDTDRFWKFP
ncbi:hypothetical protein B0H16DRAFT_368402 [Mycena metata]|uniref:F-box domain-containing protein n=1 Tax=Mycena metata TaxID=1033252 RepID=A0AAD7JK52_9AGAR|nr:hypothetical protein B0H16DRAFT_368402 [Mycena metata]